MKQGVNAAGKAAKTNPVKPKPEVKIGSGALLKPVKRIAIVGCSDSKDLAPYDDPSWEIWAMNNSYLHTKRNTRWFEIHPIKFENGHFLRRRLVRPGVFVFDRDFRGKQVDEYMKDLAALDCPVYMQQRWDVIPKSIAYPIDDVVRRFGNYFTNSVSYMIIMAIMEGATEIGCYGVDMATACTAPDVKVLRGDLKWVRADSLSVGDEVIGFDENVPTDEGHTRKWRKATVTSCPRLMKPCYRLKLEDGTEMIVSEGHGWLTNSENTHKWRRQENLITRHHRRDRPSRIIRVLDTWEQDNSWEAGYLAAAFDGEGHLSQKPRKRPDYPTYTHGIVAGFAQRENAMSETVEKIMEKYGFQCRMNMTGDTQKYRINGGKPEILRFLGSTRPPRLMDKFDAGLLGQFISKENLAVTESEFIGDHEVIGLETSTKTFIAEGLASHNSEYGPQRPSCEFHLGIAAGLGISLTIPPQADLLKTRFLYGFQEREQVAWEAKIQGIMDGMSARKAKAMSQLEISQRQVQQYIGAEEAVKEVSRIWSNLMDKKVWRDPV